MHARGSDRTVLLKGANLVSRVITGSALNALSERLAGLLGEPALDFWTSLFGETARIAESQDVIEPRIDANVDPDR